MNQQQEAISAILEIIQNDVDLLEPLSQNVPLAATMLAERRQTKARLERYIEVAQ